MIKRRRKLYKAGVLGGGTISGAQRLQQYLDAINANKVGNMLLFLPLNEESGSTAEDTSGNNYDGSYVGASLTVGGASGPITGTVAPLFGGTANAITLLNAGWLAKATGFDGAKGHLSMWLYSGNWGDTTARYILKFVGTSGAQYLIADKTTTSNQLRIAYRHTGAISSKILDIGAVASEWFNLQISWQDDAYDSVDDNDGVVATWVNNSAQLPNLTISGVFSDTSLGPANSSLLGANLDSGVSTPWAGSIALVTVFDEPQDSASRAVLATLP